MTFIDTKEYFFSAGPFRFIITASEDVIVSIGFKKQKVPQKNPEIPHNVLNLFGFFARYADRSPLLNYRIILLESGHNSDKRDEYGTASIVLDTSGYTENERRVYRELIGVAPGQRISYGELAVRCGFTGGARFIGNAMAKNRFPVIIPCHRVIKGNGEPGNYSGGADIKRNLLAHEAGGF